MDVAYVDGTQPELKEGQFTIWKQEDNEYDCRVIRRKKFFIKGVWVVAYIIQLKDMAV